MSVFCLSLNLAAAVLALGSHGTGVQAQPDWTLRSDHGVWSFVSPQGQPLWSLGVDCVDAGEAWDAFDPSNPSYAGFRLFPSGKAWAGDTLARLRSWGVNSLGGWSDVDLLKRYGGDAMLPYFVVLHLGAWDKAPWHDVFSKASQKTYDQAAASQIPKLRDDPLLVGYFTDNELGWWNESVFLNYYKMPIASPGRRVLQNLFERHYHNDFAAFKRDWITPATNFKQLEKSPSLTLRPGRDGEKLVLEWTKALATEYYAVMKRTIRKYDPKKLILGDRYVQFYTRPLAEAAAPYVDAISTNFGARWIDGTNSPFYFEGLYAVTHKPIIVSEFYFCAKENRSGNSCVGSGFPVVQTQAERARAFATNLKELACQPEIVGAHWFQFFDEPTKGRADGEDFNMGLVDHEGRPYEGMIAALKSLQPMNMRERARPARAGWFCPRAPAEPSAGLVSWPRAQGRLKPTQASTFADAYSCWNPADLYLGVYMADYYDESLWPNGRIAEADRPLVVVRVGSQTVSVRFGGHDQKVRVHPAWVKATVSDNLFSEIVLQIPASKLGLNKLAAGDRIHVEMRAYAHARADSTRWKGDLAVVK